jgi:hypothetical protein
MQILSFLLNTAYTEKTVRIIGRESLINSAGQIYFACNRAFN